MRSSSVNSSVYFIVAILTISIYALSYVYVTNECFRYNQELSRLYYQAEKVSNEIKGLKQKLNFLSSRSRIEKIAMDNFNMYLSPPVNVTIEYSLD